MKKLYNSQILLQRELDNSSITDVTLELTLTCKVSQCLNKLSMSGTGCASGHVTFQRPIFKSKTLMYFCAASVKLQNDPMRQTYLIKPQLGSYIE